MIGARASSTCSALALQTPQCRGGIQPEVVGDGRAVLLVRDQGVPRASGGVQAAHQQRDRTLPQGMLRRERARRGHGLVQRAQAQPGGGAFLQRAQPQLLQPGRFGTCVAVGELVIGVAAPQRQGGVEQLRGAGGVAVEALPRRVVARLEEAGVDLGVRECEDVAGGVCAQQRRGAAQRLAQAGDEGAQRVRGVLGQPLTPGRGGETVDRDDLAGLHDQRCEHGPLARAADRHHTTVDLELQRPQDADGRHRAPGVPVAVRRSGDGWLSTRSMTRCQHLVRQA